MNKKKVQKLDVKTLSEKDQQTVKKATAQLDKRTVERNTKAKES